MTRTRVLSLAMALLVMLLGSADAGRANVALAATCAYVGYWQVDLNGALGTLHVTPDEQTGACVGALKLDLALRWETATLNNTTAATFQWTRPETGQMYSGVANGDRILGTFNLNGAMYSWEARRTRGQEGLVELGDYNRDGVTDNQDIVAYIQSLNFKINTYRVCDDVYNPACQRDASSSLWRPDGLLKTIAEDRLDGLAVPPLAYPPTKVPAIREVGKALLSLPQAKLRGLYPSNDPWTLDFSGVVNQDGLTGRWQLTANGYRGWLTLMSRENGYGRVRLGNEEWTPIYKVAKVSATRLTFRRRLADGNEQVYTGDISGPRQSGVLGTRIAGTFTHGGRTYSWSADGTIRDVDSGLSTLDIVSNGLTGRLHLNLGDEWEGRLKLARTPDTDLDIFDTSVAWETLEQISYDPNTRQVRFRRPNGAQVYTGTLATYPNPVGLQGQFTWQTQRFDWSATPHNTDGGTYQPSCQERSDFEVGKVCRIIYLFAHSSRWSITHEIIGHGSFNAVSLGQAPFSDGDRVAYNRVGFRRDSRPMAARPGFISAYAAQNGDPSHDYVETVSAYVGDRGRLWSWAYEDLGNGSELLKKKMDLVRAVVFDDININRTWTIDANGWRGTLTLTSGASNSDLLWGQLKLANGAEEGLQRVEFNGTTLTFRRLIPGGEQFYIGQLDGTRLRGFFTHAGQTFTWRACAGESCTP